MGVTAGDENAVSRRTTRHSRRVLGDVSNKRETRSLAAKKNTRAPVPAPPQGLRRSARLCSERQKESASTDLEELDFSKQKVLSKETLNKSNGAKASSQNLPAAERRKGCFKSKETRGRSRSKNPCRVRSRSNGSQRNRKGSKQGRESKRSRAVTEDHVSKKNASNESNGRQSKRLRFRSDQISNQVKLVKRTNDFLLEANHTMVQEPFDSKKYTKGLAEHDSPSHGHVLEAPEYVTDIFQRLYRAETLSQPKLYFDEQPILTETMRAILVDWLVEVHMKFRQVPETLHLCINIIDRYFSVVAVERKDIQLVGVTALLLASKYEEIYPPEVRDCVYITDRAFSRQDILDKEAEILRVLQFKMSVPTAYPFLQRFLFITRASPIMKIAANYYLDRVLQEHEFLEYRPSVVAAAAVCLALNHPEIREADEVEDEKPGVSKALLSYTGFSAEVVINAAEMVAEKVSQLHVVSRSSRELSAVQRKYDMDEYENISGDFEAPQLEDLF